MIGITFFDERTITDERNGHMALRGDRVRQLRRQANLTQDDLAASIGVKRQSIHFYEAGKTQPTIDVFLKLVKALSTNSAYLLGELDYADPLPPGIDALCDAIDRGDEAAVDIMLRYRARQVRNNRRNFPRIKP